MKKPVPAKSAETSAVAVSKPAAVATSAIQAPTSLTGPAAVLVALATLAGAMAAVARFPNQPVPNALVAKIDVAQLALTEAISEVLPLLDGKALIPIEGAEGEIQGYDDGWIRKALEDLDPALTVRFGEIEALLDEIKAARAEAAASIAERFDAIEARLAAIEAAAVSAADAEA